MEAKVRCIDARFSERNHYELEEGKIYTIKRITGRRRSIRGRRGTDLFFELVEVPSAEYLLRRFEFVSDLSITLPDDVHNLPLI